MALNIRGSLFADNWNHSDHHNSIIDIYRVKHIFILLIRARRKVAESSHLKKVFIFGVKTALFLPKGQEWRRNKIFFNLFLTLKNS
jgi:hypothetical protein